MALTFLGALRLFAGEHPVALEKGFDPAKCAECHKDKVTGKAVHSAMAAGCISCHRVVTEKDTTNIKLAAGSAAALCFTCHADKDPARVKGRVHPPAAADCTACHDPHSSPNKFQLLKPASGDSSKDNLCLTCHEKGAKVPEKGSRHAALDAGCDTCHQTHKAGDPGKLEFAFHLVKNPPLLCLDCHDVKDKAFATAHHDQPAAKADCASCHDAHQSSSPKLMNAELHPPFGEGSCDICHQAPKDGKVVLNNDGKRVLCYTCHDDKQKQVESSKVQHPVFAATDTCTVCHNPHASRTPKLLQASQGQVCATCHEKSSEPVRHGPYDEGQCADCHDPHGSENDKLLRAKGNELCRACHVLGQPGVQPGAKTVSLPWKRELSSADYQAAPKIGLDRDGERGPPLVNHPTSGKNTRLKEDPNPITCRSCHQPHSSKVDNLMPAKVKDDIQLCETCHK